MQFYYTYLLKSQADQSIYIGHTADLKQRFREHNAGKTKSLKGKLPVDLIYFEAYLTKKLAIQRELHLKHHSMDRGRLLKRLFGD